MTSAVLLPMSFARGRDVHRLFFSVPWHSSVFLVFILVLGKVESCNFSHRTNSVRIT